ncbi:hypothetical protein [Paraburkholderia sp.]|uniref:hypothetical protein n=1 Tax=Paraburkholderia sp. TaxID=1926495 RepID=UPI00257C5772|nr:hypothetical protein [Paraburkholderia sp.]
MIRIDEVWLAVNPPHMLTGFDAGLARVVTGSAPPICTMLTCSPIVERTASRSWFTMALESC